MKVLIAIDGSASSQHVIDELKSINLDKESEVIVLSAVERVGPIMGEPLGGALIEYGARIEVQNLETAREIVNEARDKIEKKYGCYVKGEVALGSPKHVITDKADEWDVNLIILGSHGYGFLGRFLLGSVSGFVSQHAKCSVLIAKSPEGV